MGVSVTGSIFPTQRAAIMYSGNALPAGFKAKHAFVIAGRTEYGLSWFQEAANAGAIVVLYFDVTAYSNLGPAHNLYFNSGTLGGVSYGAIGTFPRGGTTAYPCVNFTTAVDYASKYEYVLRWMRSTYPWIKGFFCDDAGPDFAGYNTKSFYSATYNGQPQLTAADKAAAKTYQLNLAQRVRKVCDEFGLFCMSNAEWRSDNLNGYPTTNIDGCSLYDAGCQEHHSLSEGTYWPNVVGNSQYRLRDRNGQRCNFVIAKNSTDTSDWNNRSGVAWISEQATYGGVPPAILSVHDMGFVGSSGTPTVTVTVTPASATVQTGTTQQFTGVASNGATLTWKVDGVTGGNSTSGTITQAGLYTAPVASPAGGVVSVSASISTGESDSSPVTVTQSAPPPPSSLPAPPAPLNKAFGNRFVGGIQNAMTPNFVRGVFATAPEDGSVTHITVAIDGNGAGTASQPFKCRIYAVDAAGNPAALLQSSAEYTISTGAAPAWVTLVLDAPLSVTADSVYLLAIHSGGTEATGQFYRNDNTGASRSLADTYADGPVASMAAASTGNADVCIYAEYTPVGTAGAALAADSTGSSATIGDLTSINPAGAQNVVAINEERVVVRQVAVVYEYDPVTGVLGQQVVWNPVTQKYEPAN